MDKVYMNRALDLAKRGMGYTNPNPMVGAVIVKDKKIIGEGYHKKYGGPHAEINAFNNCIADPKGSTMYVTLEPCSHHGKTPPCANAIVKKGIKKIVIAMEDPNPQVAGRGINILRQNGVEVVTGVLEKESQRLNEIFIKYITMGLPFCIMKTAMTLDGKIATHREDSQWITGEAARKNVHFLRHGVSAIMVGIGTVLADDPRLTSRLEGLVGKNPIRVIVDTRGRIPLNSKVLQCDKDHRTILVTTELTDKMKISSIEKTGAQVLMTPIKDKYVDLSYLMEALGEQKIDSVLLEGGSTLNYSALKAGIVDKVISYIAPKIVGGATAKTPVGGEGISLMKDAILLRNMSFKKIKDDLMIEGYIRREQ